jgi:putative endonuclease
MFIVYIIHSPSRGRFYIGQTMDIEQRLLEHNSGKYSDSFTKGVNDWILFHLIQCSSRTQAISIEGHIKKMKSRKYIGNLKNFPEISQTLLLRYQ